MTNFSEFAVDFKPSVHHIMVVDDDDDIRDILQTVTESEGHVCTVASDGEMAYRMMQMSEPDVLITDVDMPKMNGIELVKLVKANFNTDVIVMSGFSQHLSYSGFIEIGANDFVKKPVTPTEMITRLNRVLQERHYRHEAQSAHRKLVSVHEALQSSYLDTIHRLALVTEYKDEDTGDHIDRIGHFCMLLARLVGLSEKEVQNIGYAAPMHDIGKIGIPDYILLKPGKLTAQEFEIMKTHATIGARILSESNSEIIQCAQQIAASHHERWDGNGYPQGLRGECIPITGRLVALADTFDALTSKRPYKSAYPLDLALEIMRKEKGFQFDPDILELFMDNIDSIVAIKEKEEDLQHDEWGDCLLSARDRRSCVSQELNYN
jgi:putative two-component system response regulator